MTRLFDTAVGQQAVHQIGNETRTLSAFERVGSEILAEALRMKGQVRSDDRVLVLPGDPDRHRPPVVTIMSPRVATVDQSRLISTDPDLRFPLPLLIQALNDAIAPDDLTPEPERMLSQTARSDYGALEQIFFITQPEILRTRRPRMVPLCVPKPHIRTEAGSSLSTGGIFCTDPYGDLGITACYHGTGPTGTRVLVDGKDRYVKSANPVQDIVFIPLTGFRPAEVTGQGGLQQNREPAKSAFVRFDGATNQNKLTRILSTDAGLLRARPTIMLKLQTDPDTDQGDSGSALIDDDDKVLGFAFERTAYDDHPQFTDWIWAANALRALNLTPYEG